MKLYHVVAMARNRVIGKDSKLPWHFPADLKHFKELTTGSTVIMGRKTYEGIGKPLANRENFVVTRTPHPCLAGRQAPISPNRGEGKGEGIHFFNSIESALRNIQTLKAFVIGGASLYEQTFSKIDGIYLTTIDAFYEGDSFYPQFSSEFKERWRKTLQSDPQIETIFYEKSGG